MDTQTDQVHAIANHHQQRTSNGAGQREAGVIGSNSSSGGSTSSSSSNSNNNSTSNSNASSSNTSSTAINASSVGCSTGMGSVSQGGDELIGINAVTHSPLGTSRHDGSPSLSSPSPLPPSTGSNFASYCISSTSSHKGLNRSNGGRKRKHSPPTSIRSKGQQQSKFVSPNALLHRRLIAKSSKRAKSTPSSSRPSKQGLHVGHSFAPATVKETQDFKEMRRSSLGDELSPSSSTSSQTKAPASSSLDTFQLQPVPASKRRRGSGTGGEKQRETKTTTGVEKRRKRDLLEPSTSSSDRHGRGILTSIAKPANREMAATPVASLFALRLARDKEEVKKTAIHFSAACYLQQSKNGVPRHGRAPKLNRTQSLPNLKAKPVLDLANPAVHRLALPPRLVEYLSLLRENAQRQQQQMQQMSQDVGSASSPRRSGTAAAAVPASASSSFARNGYCSTTIDSMGNTKSVFLPSLHPPITRQTLKELDLHEILKNPQLRHDIVFDSNVQFRPNFDGERGRKKREIGNKYWYAVQREIESGCTCTSFSGKTLLPCHCGADCSGKSTVVSRRFASQLSSVKSPMPMLANYAHSGSGFAASTRSDQGSRMAVTPAAKSPGSAIGLGNGRVPSRIPLLIQELRAICLSVLPSPTGAEASSSSNKSSGSSAKEPSRTQASDAAVGVQPTSSSARLAAASPPTSMASSASVATHHMLIAQTLDPHLITQQLQHGVLDIANLMTFLGSILKLHCAPMRDEVIEKMIKTVCKEGEVAVGLRMCFEILELMKLDIANHQLRSSRMYLIETAVDFEIRWFREKLDQGKLSLDRTTQWFSSCMQSGHHSNLATRNLAISKAFDDGLLSLVFEPPVGLGAANSTAATNAATAASTPLHVGSPSTFSSASLNHAYTTSYPETFQFDAYRLMTFHGDVTDITIVYMLLLLFRQLACSSANLSQQPLSPTSLSPSAILENASGIAARQLVSVKGEIWTLLNDADLEASAAAAGQTGLQPRTPTTPGLAGRILNHTAFSGTYKLENPRWRRAMNDVVLQIAARAIEVQTQARKPARDRLTIALSHQHPLPPSEETMKLLMRWMETNLRRGSHLHQLCQQRLQTVLSAFLDDGTARTTAAGVATVTAVRKEREEEQGEDKQSPKRIRLQDGSVRLDTGDNLAKPTSDQETKSEVEMAIQKGGLEPFTAEIKLLSERIIKVKTFHLRVFRSLYERIAGDLQQQPSA